MDKQAGFRALCIASLRLRCFTATELAGQAGVDISSVVEYLGEHFEWFVPLDQVSHDPENISDQRWRLRPEKVKDVVETVKCHERRAQRGAAGLKSNADFLEMSGRLIDSVENAPSGDTATGRVRRLRSARLYLTSVKNDLWDRYVSFNEAQCREMAAVAALSSRLAQLESQWAQDCAPPLPRALEDSLLRALVDWSVKLDAVSHTLQECPALQWSAGDDDALIRWIFSSAWGVTDVTPLLPAARALSIQAQLDDGRWGDIRAGIIRVVGMLLQQRQPVQIIAACSVLAALLQAGELALAIMAHVGTRTALLADKDPLSSRLMYLSLARLALVSALTGKDSDNAAAAVCHYLIGRDCSDSEFLQLVPGAFLCASASNDAMLTQRLDSLLSMAGLNDFESWFGRLIDEETFCRTLAIALFRRPMSADFEIRLANDLQCEGEGGFLTWIIMQESGVLKVDNEAGSQLYQLRPGEAISAVAGDQVISLNIEKCDAISLRIATGQVPRNNEEFRAVDLKKYKNLPANDPSLPATVQLSLVKSAERARFMRH